jgi:hypothetical protein
MAGENWEKRLDEMMEALSWYYNNDGAKPKLIRKGRAIKYYEAKVRNESTDGVTEWDAIRNLWQKMGYPES